MAQHRRVRIIGVVAPLVVRWIPALEKLDDEVQSLVKASNEQQCKVTWQFLIARAREKLKRYYEMVKPDNYNYGELVNPGVNELTAEAHSLSS